ncbi:MAG: flagellar biosynthesis anti-sigma factor FlgM [Gammaproteobacteria bacterium]|nr:flagellar biosynthesis anti-sigma factor FlgM [Rhodocyclaceae bacterium]MBU3909511.1 flagellar biosynthesis anti-sigma factor FlgM [Gammaproteobacteria bacterium]MBU3987808.1 flagellar biosynthesis anti-sigma factor FlgM [Gammaproteobacteria bacterium]MBU4003174.1 flagellar biosynthesis anti-sigma factor FlgM [Gammaproteobacteria bacterium]MBU4022223.1 flagellar biosynthesis anti-sigma factor FlgM [Gammaproteobacteria bacterium]
MFAATAHAIPKQEENNVKINSATPSVGTTPDSGRARGAAAPSPQPRAGTSERVDISSLSARMQEVGAGEAPVNAQRVAEIKAAISEGRFQINPERIADGLLSSVREMLGRPNPTA